MKEPQQKLDETQASLAAGNWELAHSHARAAALSLNGSTDATHLILLGDLLERLGSYEEAARCLSLGGRAKMPSALPEWDGGSLEGKTLLVEQRIRHVGAPIRMGMLLPPAAARSARCIVLAERRLVPLFRRSFPELDVREAGIADEAARAEAEVVASYETLMLHLAPTGQHISSLFAPLVPDAARVAEYRAAYRQRSPRAIGIAWSSTNTRKDLPGLADWGPALRMDETSFVVLQYGEVAADVDELRRLSGADIVHDNTVDSLQDLDTYAAQIAALDGVLTVSNTGAHLAGALGIRTIVVLDDKPHLSWPVRGSNSPWYPQVRLLRRENRSFETVLLEGKTMLAAILDQA